MVTWTNVKKTSKRIGLSTVCGLGVYLTADIAKETADNLNVHPPAEAYSSNCLDNIVKCAGHNIAYGIDGHLPLIAGGLGAIGAYNFLRKRVDKGPY